VCPTTEMADRLVGIALPRHVSQIQHQGLVTGPDGLRPVAHHEDEPVSRQIPQPGNQFGLAAQVQSSRRFVADQHGGVGVVETGQRQALPLPAGEVGRPAESGPDDSAEPGGQGIDHRVQPGGRQRRADPIVVAARRAQRDVLSDGQAQVGGVLEQHGTAHRRPGEVRAAETRHDDMSRSPVQADQRGSSQGSSCPRRWARSPPSARREARRTSRPAPAGPARDRCT